LLEFEKLKVKLAGMKRNKSKPPHSARSGTAAPPIVPSQSFEKKTFLPVDAILYPKESSQKLKQKLNARVKAGQTVKTMEAAGLKGFGKAGSRVSMLMNEKMVEEL
jgi:hypothetical protein